MFNMLQKHIKLLIKEISDICYYMNGGIQYEDLFFRTPTEREIMSDTIKEAIKARLPSKNSVPL